MGPLTFIIFSVLFYGVAGLKVGDFRVEKDCSINRTFKVDKEVPYEEFHYYNDPLTPGKLDIQNKFRIEEIEVNRTTPICCEGYQNFDVNFCIPVCKKSCGSRGICSSPEVCTCDKGYVFDEVLRNCKPHCDPECKTGSCIAPNVCSCEEGYKWSSDYLDSNRVFRVISSRHWNNDQSMKTDDCKPICNNCTHEEICIEPHICQCKQGYTRQILARPDDLDVSECKPVCDQECVNSKCVGPNECKCHKNYTRIDQFTCDIKTHALPEFGVPKNCFDKVIMRRRRLDHVDPFSEGGVVLVTEAVPICCDGYQNYDDEICIPTCNKSCGPQGICSAPNVCTCNPGYEMDDDLNECKPICERGCLNGHCIGPNICACNDGYRKVLEFACAPTCSQTCFMGTCTAPETCTCRKGFQSSPKSKYICEPIRPHHY